MSKPPSRESSTTRESPAPPTGTSTPTKGEATSNSIETAYVSDKAADDSSKLRTFLSILRKFIGVSDIASVRFSLPAQLLEPTPNLEYWNYLDRPETFVAIPDSDTPLGRMLAVLRFWFTKDLKYVKGKPCKPYNSTLGEFFRCNWDVKDELPIVHGEGAKKDSSQTVQPNEPVRLSYLTEQTSHHPPVSAFWIDCPAKQISAYGFDQLSAKFTGTAIRVTAGAHNMGIFINVHSRNNEEYQLTHPIASLGGLLRGTLSITVADTCYITCPQNKLKVILHYLEESWIPGKTQNKVEGAIYTYDPDNDKTTRLKDVPEKDVLARLEGCWHEKVYWKLPESKDNTLLIDLGPLNQLPKTPPPLPSQLTNESQRFWAGVTNAIKDKKFTEATRLKQELEERQRNKAASRKERGKEWQPRFFKDPVTSDGRPELSEEGKKALESMLKGEWSLEESEETAA